MWRTTLLCLLLALPAFAAAPRHIVIRGATPYERGFDHGKLLRNEIRELVRRWGDDIHARLGIPAPDFARLFVDQTHYVDAIRRWAPDLLEEVRGIADGAGVAFETMLVYQFGDEMWTEGESVAKHCTAIGVDRHGRRPAYVAQNMDIEELYGGFVVVMEIDDALVLTYPGLIGLNGINRSAVGVCTNSLEHLAGSRDGLPQAFVVRGLLQRKSFRDAERFLRSVRHASGQNYLVGDGDHAVSFEASAGEVIAAGAQLHGCSYHTNYPLANGDLRAGPAPRFEGRDRYAAVAKSITAIPRLKQIEEALRLPRVSNDATFAATIMVLRRGAPEILVAPGRPDRSSFEPIRFAAR
jgi:hypothetical protein